MSDQPPHDLDAERAVVGALMSGAVVDGLASAHFYLPAHQLIFEAIEGLRAAGKPADPIAVADELRRRRQLTKLGGRGANYLHDCLAAIPAPAQAGYYAGIVRELAERRRIIENVTRVLQAAADPGVSLDDVRSLRSDTSDTSDSSVRGGGARVIRLSEVEPERVEWLWPGYLPLGKLVILEGDPDMGKSVITVDLAARISTGSLMPDGAEPAKGAVLILSAEDGLADTIRPRLDAAGVGDPAEVITITGIPVTEDGETAYRPVVLPHDLPAIEQVITRNGVVLVIVDVLVAYLGGEINTYRDQDVRRALHPLAAMAERAGCCVVLLRHHTKSGGQHAIYRGGGSIGIIGAARAGFMVGTDPADPSGQTRVLAPVKTNLAKRPRSLAYRLAEADGCVRVEWLGPSDRRAADLLTDDQARDEQTDRDEAADWLTGYLKDHGSEDRAGDIIKAAAKDGIAQHTLQRARRRAGVITAKASFGGGWVWRLDPSEGDTKVTKVPMPEALSSSSSSVIFGGPEPEQGELSPDPPASDRGWPEGTIGAEANEPEPGDYDDDYEPPY